MTESLPTEKSDERDAAGVASVPGIRRRKYRLRRLVLKELRETLRDRRTIVTLILMPLLVYPALSLVFKTYLLSNIGLVPTDEPISFRIAYSGDTSDADVSTAFEQIVAGIQGATRNNSTDAGGDGVPGEAAASESLGEVVQPGGGKAIPNQEQFVPIHRHSWIPVSQTSDDTVERLVELGVADVGLYLSREERRAWQVGDLRIVARNDVFSETAANYLASKFKLLNEFDIQQRLKKVGLPDGAVVKVSSLIVGPESEPKSSFPLASLVPLVLVLMTITGAVYPAIDLTAGERERGTLETLMAAPVPRFGILFSKFLAVLTVAILTAVLNLIGMFATIWAFQLDKQFGGGMFNATVMFQIFLLLILFAAFFSALLLAVTSFAKSFKEAQVYLIPIILLSLGPGLMAMAPGMSLDGVYSVVPMMNILLLARDVIIGEVVVIPAVIAVLSTLTYAFLAIQLAAWIFGSDGILNAGSGSFAEMFLRPIKVNRVVPIFATLFCLVLLFPINFASIGYLGRLPAETVGDLQYRYLLMGLFTFIAFMVVPWAVAKHQNTNIKTGFGLNPPRIIFLVAGVLIGISLWTIVMSLTSGWHEVYGYLFGAEKQDAWHHRLVEVATAQLERISQISPLVILICFSIIPAICEEWFFRGMLFRSLLKTKAVWKAVLISAVVFGAFHTLSNSAIAIDRLIPSTLVGIMLGYLAYKSDSILPGIILHSLNNAIVIFLAYYEPSLSELPWFPDKDAPIPLSWVAGGALISAVGVALIWSAKRPIVETEEVELDSNTMIEAV